MHPAARPPIPALWVDRCEECTRYVAAVVAADAPPTSEELAALERIPEKSVVNSVVEFSAKVEEIRGNRRSGRDRLNLYHTSD